VTIAGLLDRNTEELGSLLRALNGEYVLPEAGGDLLRDGAGVLPTGDDRMTQRRTLMSRWLLLDAYCCWCWGVCNTQLLAQLSSTVPTRPCCFTCCPACDAGRNIHALDPYRMPNAAALQRGTAVGQSILEAHQERNGGALPETVAVNLWGLDAIKTKVGGLYIVALDATMLP
jgi:CobN/Magnesium Chelatase